MVQRPNSDRAKQLSNEEIAQLMGSIEQPRAVEVPTARNDDSLMQPCIDGFAQTHPQNLRNYLTVLKVFRDDYYNRMPRDPEAVLQWLRELPPVSKSKDQLKPTTRRQYYKLLRTFWDWARENWPPFGELEPFPQPYERFGKKKWKRKGK